MEEIKLEFGSVNHPVKVGNTVRRDAGPWTPTIHTLLKYLRENGFGYVPKVMGIDDKGREILQYISGEAATRPWPQVLLADAGIMQAAKLLRRYHNVVSGFKPASNAVWRFGKISLKPGQIICHGDLGPWNTIWNGEKIIALIDWDFAHPGDAIEDLAQLAYYFVPLRGESGWKSAGFEREPDIAARLSLLVKSYGRFTVNEVIERLQKLQEEDRKRTKQLGEQGIEPWASFLKRGDIKESLSDSSWLSKAKGSILSK